MSTSSFTKFYPHNLNNLFPQTPNRIMRTLQSATAIAPAAAAHHSPWHSPVSYLFGGLAAMTGLIAFALLILACSYCRLSGAGGDDEEARRREQGKTGEGAVKVSPVFEEKFLVIMAGHDLPTFVATPMFSKASLVAPLEPEFKVAVAGDEGRRDEKPKEDDDEEEETSTQQGDQTNQ